MTILCLSPHSDDAELGMGATIARMVSEGHRVYNVIFSFCHSAQLHQEAGISESILGHSIIKREYQVRRFSEYRQQILDDMINVRKMINPDYVFIPSQDDVHQDHQTIVNEAKRAFKFQTLFCYELPWNVRTFSTVAFFELTQSQLDKKIQAVGEYKSQSHRTYTDAEVIKSLAMVRGMQADTKYAEAFEIIRLKI